MLESMAVGMQGPITVTVAYFVLWYGMLFGLQSRTKYRLVREYAERGEVFHRYYTSDGEMLRADRAVQNTLEQMVPFMASMWMYAAFVSPEWGTRLGACYVGLRATYPVLLGARVSNTQSKRVAFVTFPSYGLIFWMFGSVLVAAWGG